MSDTGREIMRDTNRSTEKQNEIGKEKHRILVSLKFRVMDRQTNTKRPKNLLRHRHNV
jgi:hypothetical protein